MNKNKIFSLIFFLVITFTAAFIGSYFTTPNIESWYQNLLKPSFAPPNWLFAPVWAILFVLMAVAAFLIYPKKENSKAKSALIFYFAQLILNYLWSIFFFLF